MKRGFEGVSVNLFGRARNASRFGLDEVCGNRLGSGGFIDGLAGLVEHADKVWHSAALWAAYLRLQRARLSGDLPRRAYRGQQIEHLAGRGVRPRGSKCSHRRSQPLPSRPRARGLPPLPPDSRPNTGMRANESTLCASSVAVS